MGTRNEQFLSPALLLAPSPALPVSIGTAQTQTTLSSGTVGFGRESPLLVKRQYCPSEGKDKLSLVSGDNLFFSCEEQALLPSAPKAQN